MDKKTIYHLYKLTTLIKTVEKLCVLIHGFLKAITEIFQRLEKIEMEKAALKECLNTNSYNSYLPPSKNYKIFKKKNDPPALVLAVRN